MAVTVAGLNESAQQNATALHSSLSQLFSQPDVQDPAAMSERIQSLAHSNAQLAHRISIAGADTQTDELEDIAKACKQREDLLGKLTQFLDSSVLSLRDSLDECHKLLQQPPCIVNPETIVRYAFTLRYGFAPLGQFKNELPQLPPAPQPFPHMLASELLKHNNAVAQQQLQQAPQRELYQPQPQQQHAEAQQQEVQQTPAPFQWALNQDLAEAFSETSESYSEEEYSDD